MKQIAHKTLLLVATLLTLPAAAHAHLTGTGLGPFYDGVTHFFLSPEQIVPVFALALFAGLRGKGAGRSTLFLLPAAWLVGGIAGLARPLAGQFPLLTCFSFLVLGALVASDANLPPRFVAAVALLFGAALGYVNGSDLSTNAGTVALLGTSTAIFIVTALVAAFVASLLVPWTRIVIRVAGSWIAAAGLLLLGWTYHSHSIKF